MPASWLKIAMGSGRFKNKLLTGIRKELDRRKKMDQKMEKQIVGKGGIFEAKSLALLGMFVALMMLLDGMGFGFIMVGPIAITTMHIPVIIGALIGGRKYGIILGLAFGISSWIKAMQGLSGVFTVAFVNPLISILPRFLVGLVTALLGELLEKRKANFFVAYGIPAFVGSMTNTVLVLGSIFIVYGNQVATALGQASGQVLSMILSIAAVNGIPEALVASAVAIPLCKAYKKRYR